MCCNDGLLEVKSPHNIWHEKTRVQDLDYLFDKDGNIHLIENDGYYLERISFTGNFWTEPADVLNNFWKKIIVPKLWIIVRKKKEEREQNKNFEMKNS